MPSLTPDKPKKTRKKKSKQEEFPEEELPGLPDFPIIFNMDGGLPKSEKEEIRTIGLYGTIKEEVCAEIVYSLIILDKTGKKVIPPEKDNPKAEEEIEYKPIEMIISSYGGSAADMFSVYDTMREVRQRCDIETQGLGKIMSAAVLLLAAGTKGKRKIGKHCRVMIHGVISGQHGHISDLENEMEEAKWTQGQYVKALAEETNMTEKYIKKLIDKKVNIYLDAEEAVDLGIADIIV
jgi:ATP-dependent Clp endopeptidase proteolytic subunit ClpP